MRTLAAYLTCCCLVFLSCSESRVVRRVHEARADQRALYEVYAALLADLEDSRLNWKIRYLIMDTTLSAKDLDGDPDSPCHFFAGNHPASFQQMKADYEARKDHRIHLERNFRLAKPYNLISEAEANAFRRWDRSTEYRDARGRAKFLIQLTDVFFDNDKKFAMVYMSTRCGALCGEFGWYILERLPNGKWQMAWKTDLRDGCGGAIA